MIPETICISQQLQMQIQIQTIAFFELISPSFIEFRTSAYLRIFLELAVAFLSRRFSLKTSDLSMQVFARIVLSYKVCLIKGLPTLGDKHSTYEIKNLIDMFLLSKITDFTHNFLQMPSFPGDLEVAKSIQNSKNTRSMRRYSSLGSISRSYLV